MIEDEPTPPRQRWGHVEKKKMDYLWARVMFVKKQDIAQISALQGNAFHVIKWATSCQIVHYAHLDRRPTYHARCVVK